MTKLGEASVEMEKALKLSQFVASKASAVDPVNITAVFEEQQKQLLEQMERTWGLQGRLSYTVQFKKNKETGLAIRIDDAESLLAECKEATTNPLAQSKVMKTQIPKKNG